MLKKSSYNWSMSRLIFTALLGLVFLSSIAVADINDQVAQLDIDTATLDDIIDIFGEPVKYHWEGQTYTRDNLPDAYIVEYSDVFSIPISDGHIDELRFESPDYLFQGQIRVGSWLYDVLAVVGQPTEMVVGQPCGWQDGVLYRDIDGTAGHPDWEWGLGSTSPGASPVQGSTLPVGPPGRLLLPSLRSRKSSSTWSGPVASLTGPGS